MQLFDYFQKILNSKTRRELELSCQILIEKVRKAIRENPESATLGGIILGMLLVLFYKLFIFFAVLILIVISLLHVLSPRE